MSEGPTPPPPRPRLAGLHPGALMAHGIAAAPPDDSLPPLAGLEILGVLGQGGMGKVYLARQMGLDREVAVKMVTPSAAGDPMFLERLEREAKLMARLSHPNIVTVHQLAHFGEDGAAIVMEHVDGGNLRDQLARFPQGLPVEDALRWTKEIASALGAAHAAGVVHRDLKPENVLLTSDGVARVTDFGLAVPLEREATRLTLSSTTVGTLDYMAPERFQSGEADARSDIYALGVMLHEMLTGRIPRGSFAPAHQQRTDVPRRVGEAVLKALKPEPTERFATMAEFAAALNSPSPRAPLGSRRKMLGYGVGIGVLGLAGFAGFKALVSPDDAAGSAGESPSPDVRPVRPVRPVRQVGPVRQESPWQDALAGLDVTANALSGNWQKKGDAVFSDASIAILALRRDLPAAYAVRLRFARLSGVHSIALFFQANGSVGTVDIDGWDKNLSGVQSIDGSDLRAGGGFLFPLENQRVYELLVEVRPEVVDVHVDGRKLGTFSIAGKRLGIVSPWRLDASLPLPVLAIGSYESQTRFEKVEWRELPP